MEYQSSSEMSIIMGEVQMLASRVLQEKGRAASSSGSNMSLASRTMSFAARTSSEGSSKSLLNSSQNGVMQLAAGFQKHNISPAHSMESTAPEDATQYSQPICCLASLGSVSARKSAYIQATANAPGSSSGSSGETPLPRQKLHIARSAPTDTSAVPSHAALRKNWLQASSSAGVRTAEAAAAAAEVAKAEAAAETAAGGISVSALRSSWLQTQRQEAEAAAAAATLGAAKAGASPARPPLADASSAQVFFSTWTAAAAADVALLRPLPGQAGRQQPANAESCTRVSYTVGGSIILDKSREVSDMAERLLKERAKSEVSTGDESRVLSGGLATARSLELPTPTVLPVACGEAAPVDLEL